MDDRKLISGIKKKKESYLIEFIDIYGPVLKASIIKIIGNRKELVNEILREIFRKLYIEGYSYDDIAKIKEVPKDRLYNRVSRSKKKLKVELGGRYD